jgi:hypothetical protein
VSAALWRGLAFSFSVFQCWNYHRIRTWFKVICFFLYGAKTTLTKLVSIVLFLSRPFSGGQYVLHEGKKYMVGYEERSRLSVFTVTARSLNQSFGFHKHAKLRVRDVRNSIGAVYRHYQVEACSVSVPLRTRLCNRATYPETFSATAEQGGQRAACIQPAHMTTFANFNQLPPQMPCQER